MLLPWSRTRSPLYEQIYWNRTWLFHQIPFKGNLMRILMPRRRLLLLLLYSSNSRSGNSSSCSRSDGCGSSSGSNKTSSYGSSSKILSWTGKYKLGARADKYKLGASGLVNTIWVPGPGLGTKQKGGGREIQRPVEFRKILSWSLFWLRCFCEA